MAIYVVRSRVLSGRLSRHALLALAAAAACTAGALAGAPTLVPYSFTPLGFLSGGFVSQAAGVSPNGQIVVGSSGSFAGNEAFAWRPGTGMVTVWPVPVGNESSAFAVTDTGIIAGAQGLSGAERASRSPRAPFSIAGSASEATDLSADGETFVGRINGPLAFTSAPFYFNSTAGLVNLPLGTAAQGAATSTNNTAQFTAGWRSGTNNSIRTPALWERTSSTPLAFTATTLPISALASSAEANCVSGDGSVIVGTETSPSGTRGVRWTRPNGGGSIIAVNLPSLGGFGSSALAVSADASVTVGVAQRTNGGSAAAFWRFGQTVDLQALLGTLVPTGWNVDAITDVSANGTVVVGFARDNANRIQAYRATITRPCGRSDIASPGQLGRPDGELTADDIILFINRFSNRDARGDIAGPGQSLGADGEFTADDIIVFINAFTVAC